MLQDSARYALYLIRGIGIELLRDSKILNIHSTHCITLTNQVYVWLLIFFKLGDG